MYKERGRLGSFWPIVAASVRRRRGGSTASTWGSPVVAGDPEEPASFRGEAGVGDRRPRPTVAGEPGAAVLGGGRCAWDRPLSARAGRSARLSRFVSGRLLRDARTPAPAPRWIWLPDGADRDVFRPHRDEPDVAACAGCTACQGRFVVGLVGSIHHNPHMDLYYGWELAEALARLPADLPITGVVVGDGPGRPVLEAARDRLGLGDRLRLIGHVPHDVVPTWMNVFDVGLSTQTDDPVGWGRTTAKLPEYLACGAAVVCSDVGEAHRWLASSGQTLCYQGLRDHTYPARLAERLRAANQELGLLRAQRALAAVVRLSHSS